VRRWRLRVPLAVVVAMSASACGAPPPEEVETTTGVPVTTAAVRTGDLRGTIRATGVVEAGPGASLTITAPAAARIAELPKAEGDTVRRGDLLVRFDIPALGADAASRRAEVERAEARLKTAIAARARAHDLFDRGVAARREVEDADREQADAEAALAEARAGREAAGALSDRAIVRAPFAGVVVGRFHDPGDLVEPSASDAVLRVIDPDRLEVAAAITVQDVPRVRLGAAARIRLSGTAVEDAATVVSRPAALDAATGTVPVRLRFTAPTRLAAGTPVQVEIEAEEHQGILLVPVAAIVREGPETAVFVVSDGHAQKRTVRLGLETATQVEIESGVSAGDQVIVDGWVGLPDGAEVTDRHEAS
jgi:RND family efflux transporter MFP subunit